MNFIERFKSFVPLDRTHLDQLERIYHDEFIALGHAIEMHKSYVRCSEKDIMTELLDFLDGNGFEIKYDEDPGASKIYPILIIPLYEETVVYETTESPVGECVSAEYTVVYNASVAPTQRYILEHAELYAPWTFWLCLRRRMELLRLVPKSRSGNSPLPRPP